RNGTAVFAAHPPALTQAAALRSKPPRCPVRRSAATMRAASIVARRTKPLRAGASAGAAAASTFRMARRRPVPRFPSRPPVPPNDTPLRSMTRFRVAIHITSRRGILDPQGKTVAEALQTLGFGAVRDVCERLLANPVTEDFEIAGVEAIAA